MTGPDPQALDIAARQTDAARARGRAWSNDREHARRIVAAYLAAEQRPAPEFTHVCLDCGALGVAGGYHDHGNGNAGETIALRDLPALVRSWQAVEAPGLAEAAREAREVMERFMAISPSMQEAVRKIDAELGENDERP